MYGYVVTYWIGESCEGIESLHETEKLAEARVKKCKEQGETEYEYIIEKLKMETSMETINVKEIQAIIRASLYTEEEMKGFTEKPPEDSIVVRGVVREFGFSPRVMEYKNRIREILELLPDSFQEDKGGGWTFLNASVDKNNRHWGEQINVDELVCLGLATNQIRFCMPRHLWGILPGGVPYFVVLKNEN